jgi:hypothetical protein
MIPLPQNVAGKMVSATSHCYSCVMAALAAIDNWILDKLVKVFRFWTGLTRNTQTNRSMFPPTLLLVC